MSIPLMYIWSSFCCWIAIYFYRWIGEKKKDGCVWQKPRTSFLKQYTSPIFFKQFIFVWFLFAVKKDMIFDCFVRLLDFANSCSEASDSRERSSLAISKWVSSEHLAAPRRFRSGCMQPLLLCWSYCCCCCCCWRWWWWGGGDGGGRSRVPSLLIARSEILFQNDLIFQWCLFFHNVTIPCFVFCFCPA